MRTNFLVTTKLDRVPTDTPIAMIDGTVPGWQPRLGDYHYDHHRPGGAKVQIREIPEHEKFSEGTVVTTQVDADACVAAAYLLLSEKPRGEIYRKLEAIAFDCDYLGVPGELADLADFAAQAVAALKCQGEGIVKELGLPKNQDEWTDLDREAYYSASFRQGTWWIMEACQRKRKFPGEDGEAAEYWKQVQTDIEMILTENRITFVNRIGVVDLREMSRYVDPRAINRAILIANTGEITDISPITLVGRLRKDKKGTAYTLGSLYEHPGADKLDFSSWKIWEILSDAERQLNPDFGGWGGRATVGGSSWNDPSLLEPSEVIESVLHRLSIVRDRDFDSATLFD
jgi:hypothetical protein